MAQHKCNTVRVSKHLAERAERVRQLMEGVDAPELAPVGNNTTAVLRYALAVGLDCLEREKR